ncbi:hypothetical protein ACFZCK_14245 [Kitasatospora purpeofusca]|uniref:hypothetical protein n=1 Tax=Kitasatospora purpeofusca TaxID=67352 RepID=UPI0036F078A7
MKYLKDNPASVVSFVGALLALLAVYIPGLPQEAILGVVSALVLGGVKAQQIEHSKTEAALHQMSPFEAAALAQQALAEAEAEHAAPAVTDTGTRPLVTGLDLDDGSASIRYTE